MQSALDSYAFELKRGVSRDFKVSPEWTAELTRRLVSGGVTIEPRFESAASRLLARELETRVARMAFGDAAAKGRDLPSDHQLTTAMELLEQAATQRELFTLAHSNLATARR